MSGARSSPTPRDFQAPALASCTRACQPQAWRRGHSKMPSREKVAPAFHSKPTPHDTTSPRDSAIFRQTPVFEIQQSIPISNQSPKVQTKRRAMKMGQTLHMKRCPAWRWGSPSLSRRNDVRTIIFGPRAVFPVLKRARSNQICKLRGGSKGERQTKMFWNLGHFFRESVATKTPPP